MSRIAKVESYILTVPRDEPYLGALREGKRQTSVDTLSGRETRLSTPP